MKRLVLIAALIVSPAAAFACDVPEGWTIMKTDQATSTLVAAKLPELPVQTGQLFDVDVMICDADTDEIKLDALMPAHKHGMNYRPETKLESGQFRTSGMFFHMPGQWQISVDLQDEMKQRFYLDVAAR